MADSKISCPKCNGHIIFPRELAGQAIACPHCNETFFLPKAKSFAPWIIAAVFALITICLGALLVFQKGNRKEQTHTFVNSAKAEEVQKSPQDTSASKSADDQAVEEVCKMFYDGLSAQDAKTIYDLLSESCKKALNPQDILIDGAKYYFIDLEQVQYKTGGLGQSAMATVKRKVQDQNGTHEGLRDLKFVKESGGWKLFPASDLTRKILGEYFKSGFNEQVNADIQLLRVGDPFVAIDANNTNAFEAIYKSDQGQIPVFPWNAEFAIVTNKVDGMTLIVDYTIRNKSANAWSSPLLEFNLKRAGKVVLSGNDFLPNVQPGQTVEKSASFFLAGEPQESSKYDLDVSSSGGIEKSIQLVQNLPLEFKVQSVSEIAKLEIISTQFDLATSEDFHDMLSARINYRVKNISGEPVKSLDVKCVWYSLNGEQLDQSTDYVIGYGDVPLGVGQFKTGFIRCGKGYQNARVPVKADVYLEIGEKRSIVARGLIVR